MHSSGSISRDSNFFAPNTVRAILLILLSYMFIPGTEYRCYCCCHTAPPGAPTYPLHKNKRPQPPCCRLDVPSPLYYTYNSSSSLIFLRALRRIGKSCVHRRGAVLCTRGEVFGAQKCSFMCRLGQTIESYYRCGLGRMSGQLKPTTIHNPSCANQQRLAFYLLYVLYSNFQKILNRFSQA